MDEIWTQKNGVKIAVGDMTEAHAKNTLRFIIRKNNIAIRNQMIRPIADLIANSDWEEQFWEDEGRYGTSNT